MARKNSGHRSARLRRGLILLIAICAFNHADATSLTEKDTRIISRSLDFLEPPCSNGIVAVVYASGQATSKADATEIAMSFNEGLKAGKSALTAVAVEAALVSREKYVAIIAASGAPIDIVMQVARATHAPCITADIEEVKAGHCILAVHSEPKVDIVLNHAAATSAGLSFAAAFRMLVHEI